MPAAKPSAKVGAKVGSKAYDNKLWRKYVGPTDDPTDDTRDFMRDFYYRRRHLATAIDPNGNFRDLKYLVELEEIKWAVNDGLGSIKKRESAKIVKEVSRDLLFDVLSTIRWVRGGKPKPYRILLKELFAEARLEHAKDAKTDARLQRQAARRADSTKAIAA